MGVVRQYFRLSFVSRCIYLNFSLEKKCVPVKILQFGMRFCSIKNLSKTISIWLQQSEQVLSTSARTN